MANSNFGFAEFSADDSRSQSCFKNCVSIYSHLSLPLDRFVSLVFGVVFVLISTFCLFHSHSWSLPNYTALLHSSSLLFQLQFLPFLLFLLLFILWLLFPSNATFLFLPLLSLLLSQLLLLLLLLLSLLLFLSFSSCFSICQRKLCLIIVWIMCSCVRIVVGLFWNPKLLTEIETWKQFLTYNKQPPKFPIRMSPGEKGLCTQCWSV